MSAIDPALIAQQKLLNQLLDIANKIHRSYATHGAYIMVPNPGGWPIDNEARLILDKIDDVMFVKYGFQKTVWVGFGIANEEHKQPSTSDTWRWIINAYYRHFGNIMVGLEFEPEAAITIVPTSDVPRYPMKCVFLADPDCFTRLVELV